jgi:Flp pilus assembly pilin Flp
MPTRLLAIPSAASDAGQTYVEYALVIALLAVAVAVLNAWTGLENGLVAAFQSVINAL